MNKLKELFKNIHEIEPPSVLEKTILSRIEILRNQSLKKRLALSYFGLAFSFLTMISAIIVFGKNIWQSEFWSIFFLIFSDSLILAEYWKEFLYSLLETFPVIPTVVILAPVLILLLSLDFYLSISNQNHNRYA